MAVLVFPLLGVTRLLPWAIAVLGSCVLIAAEHGDVGNVEIAVCAALLLLVGESASLADDLAGLSSIERALALRLVARLVGETGVAAALAALVLAWASLGISAGLGALTLGLLATVSLLALVAGLVTSR